MKNAVFEDVNGHVNKDNDKYEGEMYGEHMVKKMLMERECWNLQIVPDRKLPIYGLEKMWRIR